tara:strand:+ start:348 stop:1079 length:732 start_codon:yes stop_codon:yes gene_type:complete
LEERVKKASYSEYFSKRIFGLDLTRPTPEHSVPMTALAQKRCGAKGRDCYYLSTAHSGDDRVIRVMHLAQNDNTQVKTTVKTDKLRADYSKNYGHEDRCDRIIQEIAFPFKFSSWEQSVVSNIINISISCNARALYNTMFRVNSGYKEVNCRDFIQLVSDVICPLYLTRTHELKKGKKRLCCVICYRYYEKRYKVCRYCTGCRAPFHEDCFKDFHHEYINSGGNTRLKRKFKRRKLSDDEDSE